MCDENSTELLENCVSDAKVILRDAQSLVKFGALATESCIEDDFLQLHRSFDDHYVLLKNVYLKIDEALKILDD